MATGAAWSGAAALALILAGCGQKTEPAPPPRPPAPVVAVPPGPAPPLTFSQSNRDAIVSLTLPPAVGRIPALYTHLYADGRNALQAFAEGAKGDLEEQRANGETAPPYRETRDYTVTAESGRLIGLQLAAMEDSGEAHPNNSLKGLIWDKAGGRELKAGDLFAATADMTAADEALCDAIHAARKARSGDAALTGDVTQCPKVKAASLTLAASTAPGKAGGLVALFAPFALSGGAESGYRIALPLSAIRSAIAPAYAAEFEGAPAAGAADPG